MKKKMLELGFTLLTEEVVPVWEKTEDGTKVVVGRELHEALKLKTPYSVWTSQTALKERNEKTDYWSFKNGQRKDHLFTIDMALDLARKRTTEEGSLVALRLEEVKKGNFGPLTTEMISNLSKQTSQIEKECLKVEQVQSSSHKRLTLFSQDFVPVYTTEKGTKVVLGRELHAVLKVKDNYTNWFKRMSEHQGFRRGETYFEIFQNRSDGLKGKLKQDHVMTLRMAQHIALLQNSVLGYQLRDYLLDLENNLALKDLNPSFMINNPAERARRWAEEYEEKELLEHRLKEAQPKIDFAQAVEKSDKLIYIGQLATFINDLGIPMGEKRLFAWMRENGYLKKIGPKNAPTQYSKELKVLTAKEEKIVTKYGTEKIVITPMVTGKGQGYFINKFLEIKKQEEERKADQQLLESLPF